MKAFVFVLLCALAAVEPRYYTGLSDGGDRQLAALGENPWFVHLRIAIGTSGLLDTCAGSLIDARWVVTAASCVSNVRFIWIRYGVVDVVNPSLVTETSAVRIHPEYNAATGENNIALISINRAVESSNTIKPVELSRNSEVSSPASTCGFGEKEDGTPGENLSCGESDPLSVSRHDVGAPVVEDGVQTGVLTGTDSVTPIAGYVAWINEQTGLSL